MEQHAVPRNITGFQFRLIGDMTVRQFGYLAGGAGIAYLIVKLGLFPVVISFTLAGIVGFLGFAFAFIPIQERPLDRWLGAFIRSILSPTQYLWRKRAELPDILTRPAAVQIKPLPQQHIEAHHDAKEKLQAYLKSLPATPQQTVNTREKYYIDNTLALFNNPSVVVTRITTAPAPVSSTAATTLTSAPPQTAMSSTISAPPEEIPPALKQSTIIPAPLSQTQSVAQTPPPAPATVTPTPVPIPQAPPSTSTQVSTVTHTPPVVKIPTPPAPTPAPTASVDPYEAMKKQLAQLAAEKDRLQKELNTAKQSANAPQSAVVKPTIMEEQKPQTTIKAVPMQSAAKDMGVPSIPQTPNIIIGVVRDGENKLIPNIILTVKDAKGLPLRALKTNKLGQFITATPLPNGTYFLEVEDPLKRYIFDVAEITLTGTVFPPIQITAKGEKEIIREKLTKELFGGATI